MSKRLLIIKWFVTFYSMRNKIIPVVVAVLGCMFALSACQSSPKPHAEQQILPLDKEGPLALELDENLYKAYGRWTDPAVEHILNGLLDRLASFDSKFADATKGTYVVLLKTKTPYIAPGLARRIYLSRGMLSTTLYENELAFVLATQLALIKEHATAKNLATLHSQELGESLVKLPTSPPSSEKNYLDRGWFEPGGLFDFGATAYVQAEQEAIELMYKAKYDPRGAITIFQRWSTPPLDDQMQSLGKILPEPDDQMKLARDEVAKLSPLRDPIVKSHAFEELQSRLQVKKAKSQHKDKRKAAE